MLQTAWREGLKVLADGLVVLDQHLQELRVVPPSFEPSLFRNLASPKEEAILPRKLLGCANDIVDDEPVEALEEGGAEVLMEEVNVPQTEYLLSVRVVPATQGIQVHASPKALGDVSEQPAHKGEIEGIHRNERRHVVLLLCVQIWLILFVDQGR